MWKTFHIQILTLPYSYSFSISGLANSKQSSNLVSFISCLCLMMTQLSSLALLLFMPSGNCRTTGSENKYCILFMGFPSLERHSPDCMISLPPNSTFGPVLLFFTAKEYVQWKLHCQAKQKFFCHNFIRANKYNESLSSFWQS